jgi:hypothetical protein
MIFKLLIEIEKDFFEKDDGLFWEDDCSTDSATGFFEPCYSLQNKTLREQVVIMLYFSFTSLSTVGFGDYNPKSNIERIFIAFSLMFGVAIFSLMMGNFIDILTEFKEFDADLDQGDELAKFFNIMMHFNKNEEINPTLKLEIEKFFEYKWSCDKNYALTDPKYDNITQ